MSYPISYGDFPYSYVMPEGTTDWNEACQLWQIPSISVRSQVWRRPSWRLPGFRWSLPLRRIALSTWRHLDGSWWRRSTAAEPRRGGPEENWMFPGRCLLIFDDFWRMIWQTLSCCWGYTVIQMTMTYGHDLKVGWISKSSWWTLLLQSLSLLPSLA